MSGPAIFVHIPKTGGSSLRQVLAGHFDDDHVWTAVVPDPQARAFLRDQGPRPAAHSAGARDYNRPYVTRLAELPAERRASLRLVQGHFWYGIHEELPAPATYLTMLRDPVERVLSLYQHRVNNHGLDVALEAYLGAVRDWEIDNGQTRRLCGSRDGDLRHRPCTDDLLAQAKANLADFTFVGVNERFDESLVLLRRTMGWPRAAWTRRNVTPKRLRRSDLPAATRRLLEDHNQADAELHRFATAIFEERWAAAPGADREASSLRRRKAAQERIRPVLVRARAGLRRVLR